MQLSQADRERQILTMLSAQQQAQLPETAQRKTVDIIASEPESAASVPVVTMASPLTAEETSFPGEGNLLRLSSVCHKRTSHSVPSGTVAGLQIIPSESTHVLDDDILIVSDFHLIHERHESGPVEPKSGNPVIGEVNDIARPHPARAVFEFF